MSYTSGFTAVTGATFTAAQYNTYTRDNLAALWIFTTAGDLIYATSSTTASRLARPASGVGFLCTPAGGSPTYAAVAGGYKLPRVNSAGTAGEMFSQNETTRAKRSTDLASSTIAETDILLDAEDIDDGTWHSSSSNTARITPVSAGRYETRALLEIENNSGVNIDSVTAYIKLSTGEIIGACTLVNFVNGAVLYLPVIGKTKDITAGQYFTLSTNRSNVSSNVAIKATNTWLQVERVR